MPSCIACHFTPCCYWQGISLKAQLELQRQSYRKAARILTINPSQPQPGGTPSPERPTSDSAAGKPSSDSRAGPAQPSQQDGARQIGMLANLGCVQHALGKSNTAALCFAQALRTHAQHQNVQQVLRDTSYLCIAFSVLFYCFCSAFYCCFA